MSPPASPWTGRALVLAGILLSALNLRTAVTSLTPLLSFGLTWSGGVSSAFRCLCMTALGFLPSKGTLPVTMW